MIDAELYTISVRKESIENEIFYVARVVEFPDLEEFGDTFLEARELAIESIETSYDLCIKENIHFPLPADLDLLANVSGRITLRMPKSLHAKLASEALKEDISLNQYLVSSLSLTYGQCQASQSILNELKSNFNGIKNEIHKYQRVAATYLFKEHVDNFYEKSQPKWAQIQAN
jgi:predicted RNase H-like HicB family nuclease